MRRIKFLSVFAAVALVISAWPGTAMAQGDAPPSIPGLGSSPDELTNADLARFVDLAFKEQITAPQAQAFYEQLTERQRQIISDLVGIKAGIPLIEWRRSIESYRHKTALLSSSTTSSKIAPQYAGEVWRQPIENAWTWGYPAGSTWASSYYSSPSAMMTLAMMIGPSISRLTLQIQMACAGHLTQPRSIWPSWLPMEATLTVTPSRGMRRGCASVPEALLLRVGQVMCKRTSSYTTN